MIKCRWYVLHAYSGYEKKVAESIMDQANKLAISEHIEDISVPTQNIVEVKRGVRINTERKIFPGYILIKMNLNDDTWHIIKNTPKLSGFLGNKGKPVPISNSEAKRISEQVIDGVEKSRPAVMYDIGEQVKVIDGPFASFNGEVEQIDEEKARLRVAVSIFGRLTPVDLEYSQVEKV
jgi:transcriptional antiterminator NusG